MEVTIFVRQSDLNAKTAPNTTNAGGAIQTQIIDVNQPTLVMFDENNKQVMAFPLPYAAAGWKVLGFLDGPPQQP